MPSNYAPSSSAVRFATTVSLDPASIAAATAGAVQTFTSATYPKLRGLKAGQLTFAQFKLTPVTATVYLVGAACYTDNSLTLVFANNNAGAAADLAAADFIVWQP